MTLRRPRPLALAFALATLCSVGSVPALAQGQTGKSTGFSEQRTENGSAVTFDDDIALGKAMDPYADIVKGPPRAARMQLLRPRYNFVSEMLKSVENL